MKKTIRQILNKIISPLNFELIKLQTKSSTNFDDIFVEDQLSNKIIHLNKISELSNNIQGMINVRAGEELFSLAYMQSLRGNVIEVGSFQGKSTFFLGNAVKLSGNGKMYAIDHFKGNLGKEHYYKVSKDDLSDLEGIFWENIKKANLTESVILINKPNYEAVLEIEDNSVRFLYIDGDHTADGVNKDLNLFKDKLIGGAIIVFDDYDILRFSGLVSVTNEFIAKSDVKRKYLIDRTLVVELNE